MMTPAVLLSRLVDAKLITKEQKTNIAKRAGKDAYLAYYLIRADDLVPDSILGQIMADIMAVPFIDLHKRAIGDATLRIIPEVVARSQLVIPFRQDDQFISLALFDPDRTDIISGIEKITGKQAHRFFATKENILRSLALYRTRLQEELHLLLQKERLDETMIIQLIDTLTAYALANRASDIHLEPHEDAVIIRFRIDGELHDVATLPKHLQDALITRIKILARLRTDEHTSAQDGRFHISLEDNEADIRVSIVPITTGEKTVMRLLAEHSRHYSLEDLGFGESQLATITKTIQKPYGMILATGPTGSGKTTTLYAVIKKINTRKINISTIEDPVEYHIDGVNQIQVNPNTNLTFAKGLKAILRQDPDAIMVGEIRDNETAGIAINAAMTGHVVFSTLHTNDAATAIPRLLDMHIEPFLIASTLSVIIAQRLVRRICPACIESYATSHKELDRLLANLSPQERAMLSLKQRQIRFYRGKGCDVCHHTGFEGRIGIFELLEVSEDIRRMIMSRASIDEMRKRARQLGMTSMYYDGLQKVLEGKTTIDELLHAIHE